MSEDEQILLSNLSPSLSPYSAPKLEEQLLLQVDQDHPADTTFITEKQKQSTYYIDWNQGYNHNYFTRIVIQDIQLETIELSHQIPPPTHNQQLQTSYQTIINQLQDAYNRIQSNIHAHKLNKEHRSQSIEPNKSRHTALFSRTEREFRTEYTIQKKVGKSRTKSETEGSEKSRNKGKAGKIQKYKMRHIIAQQEHEIIKECSKQNNLKNKFLASIALWQSNKERKQQERIEMEKKLTMKGVTFTPEINPKSREIMKKKGTLAPIYQRQGKKRELTERFNNEHKANRIKY